MRTGELPNPRSVNTSWLGLRVGLGSAAPGSAAGGLLVACAWSWSAVTARCHSPYRSYPADGAPKPRQELYCTTCLKASQVCGSSIYNYIHMPHTFTVELCTLVRKERGQLVLAPLLAPPHVPARLKAAQRGLQTSPFACKPKVLCGSPCQ